MTKIPAPMKMELGFFCRENFFVIASWLVTWLVVLVDDQDRLDDFTGNRSRFCFVDVLEFVEACGRLA
jgi:hypothetical protein